MPTYKVTIAPTFEFEAKNDEDLKRQIGRIRVEIVRANNGPARLSVIHAGEEASPLNINPMQDVHVEELGWEPIQILRKTEPELSRI